MRPGGSPAKGSAFERLTCRQLSAWVTAGKRDDIFSRNVLSGGQFTASHKRGSARGRAGDITGVDPLAAPFLSTFIVECKHRADLGLQAFASDEKGSAWLSRVIRHTSEQATSQGVHWLVVAKQNGRPTLVFMPGILLPIVDTGVLCHVYHIANTIVPQSVCLRFDRLLEQFDAKAVIAAAAATAP